jgi:hypothetical protein
VVQLLGEHSERDDIEHVVLEVHVLSQKRQPIWTQEVQSVIAEQFLDITGSLHTVPGFDIFDAANRTHCSFLVLKKSHTKKT